MKKEEEKIHKAATDAAEQVERTEKAVEQWKEVIKKHPNLETKGFTAKEEDKPTEEVVKENVSFLTIREAKGEAYHRSSDVYDDMKAEAKIDRECMWVLHITGGKVLKKELVSMGRGNAAFVTPREIFRRAIIEGSTKIIMVHNHPSGDPTPSESDKEVSETYVKAGELLGIPLLDFLVIGTQGYASFADEGIGGFQ